MQLIGSLLYTLFWRRFNTRGALWSMYGGLITTIVLIVFSPAVSGAKTAMIPSEIPSAICIVRQ